MVILVDTNIIIDALANREPYADDAKRIIMFPLRRVYRGF